MKKIFICSPFRGADCCPNRYLHGSQIITGHIEIARLLCKTIVTDKILPIAPHIYLTQFLDDNNPIQRQVGCNHSLALLKECSGMIIYQGCCGLSVGMQGETKEAEKLGMKMYYLAGKTTSELNYAIDFAKEC